MIRVAHFYHWTLDEVRRMRATDFESCHILMTRLDAERHLMSMAISQYPHSVEKYRKKLHKEMMSLASPIDPDASPMELADLAKIIALGGSRG